MKRYSTYITCLWLTIGVLLLSACSADVQEAAAVITPTAGADSCYINLRIENNTGMTRATEAATPAENAIYDGILCIFEGTDEATATLKTAVVIDQLIQNPGTTNDPQTVNITQRLAIGTHDYQSGQNLYALVLLNTTSTGFAIGGTNANELYFSGESQKDKTLSEVRALQILSVGSIDEHAGLYMTNAIQSGTSIMPIIDKSSVLFDTPAAAAGSAQRLTIKVERVAAKVTVINDIPAATTLSNIHLIGATSARPLIHSMSWTLASELSNGGATGADVFSLYEETSHQSGDVLYLPPTSSPTSIIVEVQLKDRSFLLGDCYGFRAWDINSLYTSQEELFNFYESGWEGQKVYYSAISSWTKEQVFLNAKVNVKKNGIADVVDVDLLSGKSGLTAAERENLTRLSETLASYTTVYRNGKMYYTFTVSELVSNNAYNLLLVEQSENDSRQTAITFKLDEGINTGATFSNGTESLFSASSVTAGTNLATQTLRDGQTLFQPTAYSGSGGNATNNIDFMITPATGWTFTPSNVSFNTTRWGTDGGKVDVSWVGDGGTTSLETGVWPNRNNATPSYTAWSSLVSASGSTGQCGLRLNLYNLGITKQVGFSDVVIEGTLRKETGIVSPTQSISGIGRDKPIEN